MAHRHQPKQQRRRNVAQADASGNADPRAPRAWASHRRPRSVALEATQDAYRTRPGYLWAHHLGPRARVPHRRRRRRRKATARRTARRAARCVLPHHRHRVHAHPRHRRAALDSEQGRRRAVHRLEGRKAPHPRSSQRCRGLRKVPRYEVRGRQAFRPRRRRVGNPNSRLDPDGRSRRRTRFGGGGHGPSRSTQRARQPDGQELRPDLQRVRRPCRSNLSAGLRRREVSPWRSGQVPESRWL